jgi:uncharacterized protein (TIGR03435 family)
MKSTLCVLSLALLFNVVLTCGVVFGQSSTAAPIAPDVVASIKPNKSGDTSVSVRMSPGMFTATNYAVRGLITMAYELQTVEVLNVPARAGEERFDIVAKFDDASAASGNTPAMRQMLKQLLAERFKLVLHKEIKDIPTYALVLDRRDGTLGSGLRVSTQVCQPGAPTATGERPCGLFGGPLSQMQGDAVTMTLFSKFLSSVVQRVVVDRTGLSGKYDVDLSFSLGMPAGDSNAPPSIFTALKEQLALQLRAETGPIEVTIVDRFERPDPE